MSEFKFTKGKWEIKDSTKIVIGKQPVCDAWYFGEIDIEDAKFNAKLISCAPKMLRMLIKLNNFCTMKVEDRNELEELIKKATEL